MPSVFNWQLGRDMLYPHEERHPSLQFAFVFNPNRCIGCQTCTMACKSTWTFSKGQELMWWNNVETKPYGGYPQHWDAKLLAMLEEVNPEKQIWNAREKDLEHHPYGVFEGMTIFEAADKQPRPDGPQQALGYLPTDDEWRSPNIHEDTATGGSFQQDREFGGSAQLPEHKVWFFHLARICNHCTYPGCLGSCPRNAIYKRPEDGVVLIDQSRCRGYRKCVEGCPYKKAMYRPTTGTSEKCLACFPRLEGQDKTVSPSGAPAETRCMSACVGKIRLQGLVKIGEDGRWAQDPTNPLYYLIRERQIALPLYPQFGTEPNGFYIPPRWVPRDYLVQMFGPGVDHAIEQYSCPDRELLAVLQLFRTNQQILFRYEVLKGKKVGEVEVTMPNGDSKTQEIFNDTVIGYNKFDEEVVRITVEEPTFRTSCPSPRQLHLMCLMTKTLATTRTFDLALNLARQSLYRFAATALLDPQVGAWKELDALRQSDLLDEAARLICRVPAVQEVALGLGELSPTTLTPRAVLDRLPATPEALNRSYERTFGLLVSNACPPYETEYINNKFTFQRSHALADISGFYAAFGLTPATSHPERHDHIVLELEFMAVLIGLERQAAHSQALADVERSEICRQAQLKFLREHLAWWTPAFCRLLSQEDRDGYYQAVAALLAALIPAERGFLGVPVPSQLVEPSPLEIAEECEGCQLNT